MNYLKSWSPSKPTSDPTPAPAPTDPPPRIRRSSLSSLPKKQAIAAQQSSPALSSKAFKQSSGGGGGLNGGGEGGRQRSSSFHPSSFQKTTTPAAARERASSYNPSAPKPAVDSQLSKNSVDNLISHSLKMQAKAEHFAIHPMKSTPPPSASSLNTNFTFDPKNPESNLTINSGPLPFNQNLVKVSKVKVKKSKGPLIENNTTLFDAIPDDDVKTEKPKDFKPMSDTQKRASIMSGSSNPAARMRKQLEYDSQLAKYSEEEKQRKKEKRKMSYAAEDDDDFDKNGLANYGIVALQRVSSSVNVSRKNTIDMIGDDEIERINNQYEEERKLELEIVNKRKTAERERAMVDERLGVDRINKIDPFHKRVAFFVAQPFKTLTKTHSSTSKIHPFVWIGNESSSLYFNNLVTLGITHILNLGKDCKNSFPKDFIYCKIGMLDSSDQILEGVFESSLDFLERVRKAGGRCLIHCKSGNALTCLVVISYLISHERVLLGDAYKYIKYFQPAMQLNRTFLYELALLELHTHASTSVAKHYLWRFSEYEDLKTNFDPRYKSERKRGIRRATGYGIFWIFFRSSLKFGIERKRGGFLKWIGRVCGRGGDRVIHGGGEEKGED